MLPVESIQAVVQVTEQGRGFVVEGRRGRYIVTASHCLPHLPGLGMLTHEKERTYRKLLGPLKTKTPQISAECLFVDPLSDIAVLCGPDHETYSAESNAYEHFVEEPVPLSIRRICDGEQVWHLSLGGIWFPGTLRDWGHRFMVSATEPVAGGMSGSPILGDDGKVVGVCCVGADEEDDPDMCRESGPNPDMTNFPVWLFEELISWARWPER